jgi:hypothetical protein
MTTVKSQDSFPSEPGLAVRKARNGHGIFTTRAFSKGHTIYRVKGKRYHYTALLRRGGTFLDNCFRYGPETYLSPEGYIGVYQNHSCEPNARVEKRNTKLYVVALQAIPKNTEVVIDYATITAADDIWTLRCNCGSGNCRKRIGSYVALQKSIFETYTRHGLIPTFILRISA